MSSESVHVNLKKFDCKNAMKKKFNAIVVGKRNTGKSVLISEILYYLSKQKMPRACVFSATEESNRFFCKFVPDSFIFDDSSVEHRLEAIVAEQKKLQIQKQMGELSRDTDLGMVIVLDDIGYNKGVLRSKIVRYLFLNGRHLEITMIVALQHLMQLTVDLRSNSDYVICLKEGNKNIIKNLHDNFFGVFEKLSHFRNAFDACTKDYGCMVLNNTVQDVTVNEMVHWYKATPGREFRLGSKEFWKYHESRYISKEERYMMENVGRDEDKTTSRDGSFVIHKER